MEEFSKINRFEVISEYIKIKSRINKIYELQIPLTWIKFLQLCLTYAGLNLVDGYNLWDFINKNNSGTIFKI